MPQSLNGHRPCRAWMVYACKTAAGASLIPTTYMASLAWTWSAAPRLSEGSIAARDAGSTGSRKQEAMRRDRRAMPHTSPDDETCVGSGRGTARRWAGRRRFPWRAGRPRQTPRAFNFGPGISARYNNQQLQLPSPSLTQPCPTSSRSLPARSGITLIHPSSALTLYGEKQRLLALQDSSSTVRLTFTSTSPHLHLCHGVCSLATSPFLPLRNASSIPRQPSVNSLSSAFVPESGLVRVLSRLSACAAHDSP